MSQNVMKVVVASYNEAVQWSTKVVRISMHFINVFFWNDFFFVETKEEMLMTFSDIRVIFKFGFIRVFHP